MKSSSGLVLPGGMTGASYLISMVFKICRPKPPRANIPLEWKPCLEHVRQSSGRVGQSLAYVLSLDFYRWQFNPLGSIRQSEQNHAYLICYHQGAVGCTLDKYGL